MTGIKQTASGTASTSDKCKSTTSAAAASSSSLSPAGQRQNSKMPHVVTRLPITDINSHLTCMLCLGYMIDASTLVECLHSFCRACLLRYLETTPACPNCEAEINMNQLNKCITADRTLQDLIYKLVPGLYKSELRRRKDFYLEQCKSVADDAPSSSKAESVIPSGMQIFDKHLVDLSAFICTPDEIISFSLETSPKKAQEKSQTQSSTDQNSSKDTKQKNGQDYNMKRYFRCPAAVTIGHLKKLLSYKLELSSAHQVEILHSDEPLLDEYTLMDIAYIYTWRRKAPMQLFFNICKYEIEEEPMPLLEPEISTTTTISNETPSTSTSSKSLSSPVDLKKEITPTPESKLFSPPSMELAASAGTKSDSKKPRQNGTTRKGSSAKLSNGSTNESNSDSDFGASSRKSSSGGDLKSTNRLSGDRDSKADKSANKSTGDSKLVKSIEGARVDKSRDSSSLDGSADDTAPKLTTAESKSTKKVADAPKSTRKSNDHIDGPKPKKNSSTTKPSYGMISNSTTPSTNGVNLGNPNSKNPWLSPVSSISATSTPINLISTPVGTPMNVSSTSATNSSPSKTPAMNSTPTANPSAPAPSSTPVASTNPAPASAKPYAPSLAATNRTVPVKQTPPSNSSTTTPPRRSPESETMRGKPPLPLNRAEEFLNSMNSHRRSNHRVNGGFAQSRTPPSSVRWALPTAAAANVNGKRKSTEKKPPESSTTNAEAKRKFEPTSPTVVAALQKMKDTYGSASAPVPPNSQKNRSPPSQGPTIKLPASTTLVTQQSMLPNSAPSNSASPGSNHFPTLASQLSTRPTVPPVVPHVQKLPAANSTTIPLLDQRATPIPSAPVAPQIKWTPPITIDTTTPQRPIASPDSSSANTSPASSSSFQSGYSAKDDYDGPYKPTQAQSACNQPAKLRLKKSLSIVVQELMTSNAATDSTAAVASPPKKFKFDNNGTTTGASMLDGEQRRSEIH